MTTYESFLYRYRGSRRNSKNKDSYGSLLMTLTSVDDWTIIFDIPIWLWKSFTIIDTLCIWSPGIVDFNILFVTDLVLFYVWSVFFAWTVYHLRCLCPWIVRLNTLEYRPSGYVIGLLKFCVSASFWQFRDIILSFCVLSVYFCFLSIYMYSHTYVYIPVHRLSFTLQ